jgi:cyclopropane fatty-acyl-phospholipid synthase-like methyltransferase
MSALRKKIFYYLSYFRNPPWDTGISPPELIAFIHSHPPGRALDLGCGTGTNTITLAKEGWQVTGVDFVGKAIRKARVKAKQAGVKVDYHVSDVTKLEYIPWQFDLILDIGCYHSLSPEGKKVYAENLERLLSPGGSYLLYGFLTQIPDTSIGITSMDIESIKSVAPMVNQELGSDRGQRASAWLTFQR